MTQFCIECGAALRPTVKFCTKCGAAAGGDVVAAAEPVHAEAEVPPPIFKRYLPHLLAAMVLLPLAAFGINLFFGVPKTELPDDYNACADATTAAPADCATAAAPTITGQVTSLFIVADANVRNRATAQGSNIIKKMLRGTSVSGIMQIGEDGTSQWFKLDGDAGFIGAVNLSGVAPPKLAKIFTDMLWNVEIETDILALPAEGSAVVGHLNVADQVTLAGVTENGYVETKRNKGGVGYFLATAANDRTGALMLDSGYGGSALGKPTATAKIEDLGEDPPNMPSPDYGGLASGEKTTSRQTVGDQAIIIEQVGPGVYPNQSVGRIWYRNTKSGKSCSSHLFSDGKEADWFAIYRQEALADDKPCSWYAIVKMGAGHEGMRYFGWWRGGKEIMGDSFE
jgi:hypothetical protein